MNRATSIYPFRKQIQRELQKIEQDPFNANAILKYYQARVAEGISPARIYKCVSTLKLISKRLGKSFEGATKEDFVRLIAGVEETESFSDWTKRDYKVILKHFYKWLRGWEDGSPPETRWIKRCSSGIENRRPILQKDLLTEGEKLSLMKAARNPRDRALIEVFSESGRRLGELLTLRIQDVEFDSIGAKLFVNGKVGEDFARIIGSAPSLATWLDNHPRREDPSAPLWIGYGPYNRAEQLSYAAARKMLDDASKRAGIRKRVHFYLFRHTRIDETQGILTEAQQCMMFGWKFGSKMPAVYFKRSGRHIDNAQAIMNGIKIPDQKGITVTKPRNCFRCRADNSPVAKFCNKCGAVLDSETAIQIDEEKKKFYRALDSIADNPELRKKLLALLGSV